ncbi:MAG: phosphatidate cytidylyltransferase [Treponema sp.]|nr:phosphatidate cytidylyltransferase [Treponema sp.]MCL2271365.1 phosphatidate cytidylyltransferase [Treponema sp.]
MKKIIERLLIFFVGIPVLFALVFLLPHCRHLAFNVAVVLFSAVGALELSNMFRKKNIGICKAEAVILGSLAPLTAVFQVCFNFPGWIIPLVIMAGVSWILLSLSFTSLKNMDNVFNSTAGRFTVMIYPSFLLFWIVKMSVWELSGAIFLFLLIVFFNDGSAWFFGNLFGKNNRGLIPASPNKSMAGFIGGFIASITIPVTAAVFFPSVFYANNGETVFSSPVYAAVILGLFTGIFATLGDLAESAIKRSCDVKNSGRIFMERGGILDSVDSIGAAAPVFFLIYNLLFF